MTVAASVSDQLSAQNPWPGLRAFTESDREFFFGREREIAELLGLVRRSPVVVLYGQSGLGKTSLLQAGLFPELKQLDFLSLRLRLDHGDGAAPLAQQIKTALAAELDRTQVAASRPGQNETLWEYFHRRDVDFWGPRNRLLTPIIALDQFEEVFTLGQRNETAAARVTQFTAELEALLEHRPPDSIRKRLEANPEEALHYDLQRQPVKLVISLREDFLPHLDTWRTRIPSLLPNRFRLERMTGAQALDVVQRAGKDLVEPAVARSIVDFVSASQRRRTDGRALEQREVEPALLSLVCDQLNRRRIERSQQQITADLLSGESEGIIQDFYTHAFDGVDARVRDWVEDELLTSSGYRHRAALEDALKLGLPETDFAQLEDRRILHREEREGVVWLELTHDLLTDPAARSRAARERRRQAEAAAAREMELTRKTRRLKRICVGLAALCLLILAGVWQHKYYYSIPYVVYYSHFTKCFGIPHGLGRLDESQTHRRRYSLRFTSLGKRGPLLRVEAVDSSGNLTYRHGIGTYLNVSDQDEGPNQVCQWEFVPDAKGSVAYEMAFDRYTNLVWALVYSPSTTNKYQRLAHFVGPNGWPQPQKRSSADYVLIEYTADGLERKLSYSDQYGRPQPGPNASFADRNQYDRHGLVIRTESLDTNGNLMLDTRGIAVSDAVYDQQGNVIEWRYSDTENRASLTKDGYAKVTMKYDDVGNLIEEGDFDTEGRPAVERSTGSHKRKAMYDARGNCTNTAYFGVNDQPCLTIDGYARIGAKYDERGNRTEETYFGIDGEPTFTKQGYAMLRAEYDDQGNWTNFVILDTQDKPTFTKQLCAGANAKYDERGNRVERVFLNKAGRPTPTKDGYAIIREKFDDHGNRIESACFDSDDKPTTDQSNGVHKIEKTYDPRGRQIAEAYFDTNDRPTLHAIGYAKITVKYDRRGNRIEWACFDVEGKPTVDQSTASHMWKAAYDDRGNFTNMVYFGTDGKVTNTTITAKYDDRSNQIECAYFDSIGAPTLDQSSGVHKIKKTYDPCGRQIAEAYFDADGKPTLHTNGCAKITVKYDSRGNQIERACFDAEDWPATDESSNTHMWKAAYDECGNWTNWVYYGADGKPALSKDGYAMIRAKYDDRDNRIEWACFDAEGRPTVNPADGSHMWKAGYDDCGNWTNWVYYGTDGKTAVVKDGYAMVKAKYDERCNRIEWACFDADGKPTVGEKGYAIVVTTYGEQRNVVARKFSDADRHPVEVRPYIVKVLPGGQGEEIGLRPDDVILAYDGKEVSLTTDLTNMVLAPGTGSRQIKILRVDQVLLFNVKPGRLGVMLDDRAIRSPNATPHP